VLIAGAGLGRYEKEAKAETQISPSATMSSLTEERRIELLPPNRPSPYQGVSSVIVKR
jgi:hypothetical protein